MGMLFSLSALLISSLGAQMTPMDEETTLAIALIFFAASTVVAIAMSAPSDDSAAQQDDEVIQALLHAPHGLRGDPADHLGDQRAGAAHLADHVAALHPSYNFV